MSPVDSINNISLKRRMSKKDYDKLLSTLPTFNVELYLSYKHMGFSAALINSSIRWYELASYITIKENNDILSKVYLHINDFIIIQEEKYKESYAIVKGIFKHKGNDGNNYAFVVVDWFEDTGREYPLLKCPFYSLQTKNWRHVFPLNILDNVQKVHFIHYSDNRWIKNNFYFTAI
jgi:hypothetical protein